MRNIILNHPDSINKKVAALLAGSALLLASGCTGGPASEESEAYREHAELIGEEKKELIENVSQSVFEPVTRGDETGETVQLNVEEAYEELTVETGRYHISGDSGIVRIYDEEGGVLIDEVMGGMGSVTVDLDESYTIWVSGFDDFTMEPAATELSHELSAGIWVVGTDIEEGVYSVTVPQGLGSLQKFSRDGEVTVYELLGGDISYTESDIVLEEGQTLRISRLNEVEFEPVPQS